MKNTSLFAPVADTNVRMIKVTLGANGGRVYTYKTTLQDLEKGDLVVVQAKDFFTVGRVYNADNVPIPIEDEDTAYKWAFAKVDEGAIEGLLKSEAELIDKMNARRVDNMRAQMMAALGIEPTDDL